jgi:hypothetical protein
LLDQITALLASSCRGTDLPQKIFQDAAWRPMM